jgi:hypothetical protein
MKATLSALQIRGREWQRLPSVRRESLSRLAFRYWRQRGFPHYELNESEIAREVECLVAQPTLTAFRPNGALGSVLGLRVASFFHPHMWSVRVSRYRSPMDVFVDDDLLLAALKRAWKVWPDRFGANASCLRRMLKTFPGTASVSNFRPTLARAVAARYSPAGGTIVDFSAGYGGRLLGCLTVDRHYIGIEPSGHQVKGLRRTIQVLGRAGVVAGTAVVHHGCAEDILGTSMSADAQLVFSSPPYYDWERYSIHHTQSYVRYRTYDRWLRGFLVPVIDQSYRMLDRAGRLVLNVSNGHRLPSANDVERIAARAGFVIIERLPLLMARVPYLHPRADGPFKPELLLVFRKKMRTAR